MFFLKNKKNIAVFFGGGGVEQKWFNQGNTRIGVCLCWMTAIFLNTVFQLITSMMNEETISMPTFFFIIIFVTFIFYEEQPWPSGYWIKAT